MAHVDCQIMAGIELGDDWHPQRVLYPRYCPDPECRRRESLLSAAIQFDLPVMHGMRMSMVVLLNTRHEPIATYQVSVGTLDASPVHPREIFRPAIKEAAKAILVVHNHPSGDPTPGEADVRATRRLVEAANIVGIELLDHIVVAKQGVVSLRERGLGFALDSP